MGFILCGKYVNIDVNLKQAEYDIRDAIPYFYSYQDYKN